jgi:glycosyltransferase involved in cell wall biosynthesis
MKILHIISGMNPETGGVCKAVRDIIDGMKILEPKFVNEVVCLDPKNAAYLEKDTFSITALGGKKTSWLYSKELMPWLKKHTKEYDLLIVHGLWQYLSYAVCEVAKEEKKPYYVMPHGMLDPYFQKAKERKLKAIRNSIFWQLIDKKLINNAKGVLFTCEEEKQLARTTFPSYRPKSEKVVGLGVDLPPAETENMKKELKIKVPEWNGKPFILFLGRLHLKKGVDLLIEAYTKLEKEYKELPQLIIAGPGLETEYGKAVMQQAKGSKRIYFPGMLTGEARWGAFYKAEAFVLPSHQENFGIAVVEALACETPVLISNKVNIWREIKEANGGIVKNDNSQETYHLLKDWLSLSILKKQEMNASAKKVYHSKFTITQAVKQLLKVIVNK